MTVEKLSGDLETTIDESIDDAGRHQLFIDITPQIKSIAENGNRISADTQQMMRSIRAGRARIAVDQ